MHEATLGADVQLGNANGALLGTLYGETAHGTESIGTLDHVPDAADASVAVGEHGQSISTGKERTLK